MNEVVIFQSDLFALSWDLKQEELGQDCAIFFMNQLQERGVDLEQDVPITGELGWTFGVRIKEDIFSAFVHWFSKGQEPPQDYWAIQLSRQKGVIATLFGRKTKEDVGPIANLVADIILKEPRITNVRWLTYEEFRSIYGSP